MDKSPGGTLADYVPFYFASRSPMLFAIYKGVVAGYKGGQADVIYLTSSVEAISQGSSPFVFTDGHADMVPLSRFYNDPKDLQLIDWKVMKSKEWYDTETDGDRKRRRQAEFLVSRFFPFNAISSIGVMNLAVSKKVKTMIASCDHRPTVAIEPSWYY